MKGLLLVLAVLLPFTVGAQQMDSSRVQEQPGLHGSVPEDTSSARDAGDVSSEPGGSTTTLSVSGPEPDAPPQTSKPAQSKKPKEPSKPPIEGSMVGYIDDAIIGSQIRIRFDAGFHDNAPDRAEFFYPQCACNGGAPGPDFPGASNNINFQQLYFQAEYSPVSRFSIFTEIPIRWIQPQSFIPGTFAASEKPSFRTISGISDVRAGLKVALAASSNHSLTFQFKAYFPSGDGSRGLGTDHYSIEPSLLYYQRLSQRWAVESQIGGWHPIGGSMGTAVGAQAPSSFAGEVFFYGIGPSYQLIDGEHIKFAPVAELFGWNVRGGLQTLSPFNPSCSNGTPIGCSHDASGTNIINLKVGARTSIGRRNSFYVGFGQAVTHSVWYEHIVRAEYRYSF